MTTQLTKTSMPCKGLLCFPLIYLLIFNTYSVGHKGFSLIGSKKESKVKFELINNLVVVPIQLNNGQWTKAVVDTGIRSVVLYGKKFQKQLNFNNSRDVKINGLGKGRRQQGKLAVDNAVRIGDVLGEGVAIVSVDEEIPFEILSENGVEAILGYQLFNQFIIEIDYLNNEITFRDPVFFTANPLAHQFHIEVIDTKPYITTSIKIRNEHSEIIAHEMKVLLDTGAALDMMIYNGSKNAKLFTLDKSSKGSIGLGMNGKIGGYSTTDLSIIVGNVNLKSIAVNVADRRSGSRYSKHYGVDGLIGGNVLKHFKVTFDYINGDVYLEEPES
jgi:hypothetical protein